MTLRDRTMKLIEEKGVKKSFIAKNINISNSLFSMFIHNKQPLQRPERTKLEKFIESYK